MEMLGASACGCKGRELTAKRDRKSPRADAGQMPASYPHPQMALEKRHRQMFTTGHMREEVPIIVISPRFHAEKDLEGAIPTR